MSMKFLIPVDHSDASEKAVRFVEQLLDFTRIESVISLFHVVESLPDFLVSRRRQHGKTNDGLSSNLELINEARIKEGHELLDGYRQALVGAGVPGERVTTQLVSADALPEAGKVVAAGEIIRLLKAEDYDVIVLGRRATSPIGLTTVGSVTEKVLRESAGMTVWIVD